MSMRCIIGETLNIKMLIAIENNLWFHTSDIPSSIGKCCMTIYPPFAHKQMQYECNFGHSCNDTKSNLQCKIKLRQEESLGCHEVSAYKILKLNQSHNKTLSYYSSDKVYWNFTMMIVTSQAIWASERPTSSDAQSPIRTT